jgi:nucleoside-diphosphate-sugar epimerase
MKPVFPSKRLLITGIESFTGKYIRELFEINGYDVYGTLLGETSEKKMYPCDITKADQISAIVADVRPDIVIHLAAITFVPDGNSVTIYDVNLFATLNLLDALIEHRIPVKKVILPSTSNVYGNLELEAIKEDQCPQPLSHYALSKYAMEQMSKNYFLKLPIIITRPFNYSGVGQAEHFIIPKIVSLFRNRQPVLKLGNIDIYRDFSDVRDVANAYLTLAESALTSEIINISSGTIHSLQEIISMAASATNHQLEIYVDPAFVRPHEIKRLGGDNSRLCTLGWKRRYSLPETIEWMIKILE